MCISNSQCIPKLLCLFILILSEYSECLVLRAYISQHGLHGEIEFSHKNESIIHIRTNLKTTLQYPDGVFRWTVHEFPVDYRILTGDRCSQVNLGRELIDLTDELGFLIIPGKDHAQFESKNSLTGPKGLWGKSIVFETAERDRIICASILSTEQMYEKHAIAKFTAPVAGTLHFRWLSAREFDETDSYIQSELYHTKAVLDNVEYTEHNWKLFVTDIFDSDKGNHEGNCNVLQMVFDPENSPDGMSVGDLDSRLGLIKVARDANVKRIKSLYKDEVINVLRSDMEVTKRSLYVVIYDNKHPDSFLSCAKLRLIPPKSSKALINMDGIRGMVEFSQRSPFDPTWVNFQLGAADQEYESNLRFVGSMLRYTVRALPPRTPDKDNMETICNTTGGIYNPTALVGNTIPPPGMSTQDQYPVGDLFGKYKDRTEYLNHKYLLPGLANELSGTYWDVYLPLQGPHSVMHRALVLERRRPKRDVCGTIVQYEFGTEYQTPMTTAQAVYRYPLVGRVLFRQPQDRHWDDTTIIIEGMVHADGANTNNSHAHRWALHEQAPGADYYNWSRRCVSAGSMFDPHHLDIDTRYPHQYCRPGLDGLCRLGDLTTRHGTLSVAGRKAEREQLTRRLFTDTALALSGRHSIIRRSLVLYDDHGPVARGERMACSIVLGLPRLKGVVQSWFGNGEEVGVKGRLELVQQSQYDTTNVRVALDHMRDVHNYNVHLTPVEPDLEFPCENSTLYDVYNPFNVAKGSVPPPLKGTADQYPLGDLGNKYGLIESKSFSTYFNETQLSLFGPYTVLGRSVVLHQKGGRRWACASVVRGYSPGEARELRAIASFHHPRGFLWGWVRMSQLVYHGGGAADTTLLVNLKYPGEHDTNKTLSHGWAVYVNPVGVDATVAVTATRCVAGGYRWNPYFTQLADPLNRDLYNQECGADNPLRCDVGDLTGKLGTIDIGTTRQSFVDSNLPLEGPVSAVGRSLVVLGHDGAPLACANIEPDHDVVKYVNIMKPPRFVLGQFLSSVRGVLGAPPWMVWAEARRTRRLHAGGCLQLLLHFTGPHAHKLELDFTRLMSSGRLEAASVPVAGYADPKRKSTISYRLCGVTDPNDNKRNTYFFSSSPPAPLPTLSYTAVALALAAIL